VLVVVFLYGGGAGFREGTIFYVVVAMLFVGAAIMWRASKSVEEQTRQHPNPLEEKEKAKLALRQKGRARFSNEKCSFGFCFP
jgi:hypothetical protein